MHGFVIVIEQEEELAIIQSDKDLCEIIDFDLHQKISRSNPLMG